MRVFIAALLWLSLAVPCNAQLAGGLQFPGPGTAHTSSSTDPATTAWVNAVSAAGGTVSAPRQTIVNTFIVCVKAASLWTTLDRYWLLAGEDPQSAKVDMVNLSSFTVVNSPSFTASQGYDAITAGAGNYINTGYTPSTDAVNLTTNSATVGGTLIVSNTTNSDWIWGGADGSFTNVISFIPYQSGFDTDIRINSSSNNGGEAVSNAAGSWINSRTSSTAVAAYGYGTLAGVSGLLNTYSTSSTALPNSPMYILAISQGGSPAAWGVANRVATHFYAAGWNSTQVGNFETCQNAMLTSIGINVH